MYIILSIYVILLADKAKFDKLIALRNNILEPQILNLLSNSVHPLFDGDLLPIGVCFFIKENLVVTAERNLSENQTEIICRINGENVILNVSKRCKKYDIAFLTSVNSYPFLKLSIDAPPRGTKAVVAAYQIGIQEDLDDSFGDISFGVSDATIVKVSKHHVVYSAVTFNGDSGAAVTLNHGEVVAIHLEGVNQAKERYRKSKDLEERLDEVENSVDLLVRSLSNGSVGLLSTVIIELMK